MYQILKNISDTNDYPFEYARRDFQNLYEEVEQLNVPHIFLDPVTETREFGDYGEHISTTYEGSFLMVVSSDFEDESYEYKYTENIKPLLSSSMAVITDGIKCNATLEIQQWRMVEVINIFDYTMDGIACTFNVKEKI